MMFLFGLAVGFICGVCAVVIVHHLRTSVTNGDANWQANNDFIESVRNRNKDYFNNPVVREMQRQKDKP